MKKSLLLFFTLLLTISQNLFAQEAKIKLRDFRETSVVIMGVSKDYIFSKNNNFELSDIEKIYFGQKQEKYEHVYKTLSDAGIVIIFDQEIIVEDEPFDVKQNTATTSASIREKNINPAEVSQKTLALWSANDDNEFIINQLMLFKEQRFLGKGLQLAGVTLAVVSGLILVPEIAILGGLAMIVGVIIDFDAGKHLDIKKIKNKKT